ncbi:MAG: hypothetical protein HY053_04460 [Proteobacteria bacterium]|nr:hypothetical protein [Pseudomonadota bacterium]
MVKRWLRRAWAEWRIGLRRKELLAALSAHFGGVRGLHFIYRGDRGRDSIYLLTDATKTLGIMRLVNPHYHKTLPPDWPFQLELQGGQIDREWAAYSRGYVAGLTPKPLWRTQDALLCEYMPYGSMHDTLLQSPEQAWSMMCEGSKALQRLHQAGLTHMDASFANMLKSDKGQIYIIDFEYAPARGLSLAAQRVYDHLRLLESTWKFILPAERGNYQPWLDCLVKCLDDDMRKVDLRPLAPAIDRVMQTPVLGQKIRNLFNSPLPSARLRQEATAGLG